VRTLPAGAPLRLRGPVRRRVRGGVAMSPNPLGGRVDQLAQAVAARVVAIVLDAIDINAVVSRVDIDALVSRVDVDRIVSTVDIDALIDRVDVEKIIERVDVNAIVGRVDIDRIVGQLDIDSLMEKTELGSIIARSTTGVASEVLDLVRAQGVGLDDFFARWTNRILRRDPSELPIGPPLLVPDRPALGAGTTDGEAA